MNEIAFKPVPHNTKPVLLRIEDATYELPAAPPAEMMLIGLTANAREVTRLEFLEMLNSLFGEDGLRELVARHQLSWHQLIELWEVIGRYYDQAGGRTRAELEEDDGDDRVLDVKLEA